MPKIILPKKWNELTNKEQIEWINQHFDIKRKIPEPRLKSDDKIAEFIIKTKSGKKIESKDIEVEVSVKNTNLVREFEAWVGKWLITIFHDKKFPHIKIIGVSNPSSKKWIAQQLSSEVWGNLFGNFTRIGNIYGFCGKKRSKKRFKK